MSTCPEKDIHSIYLDNELPMAYVAEYEKHVSNCPKCQAELNRIKGMRNLFTADRNSFEISQEQIDKSFDRLQARLSYSKVTKSSRPSYNYISTGFIGGAIAAAFILLVLPARLSPAKNEIPAETVTASSENFQPVARTALVSPAEATVKIDGTIPYSTLASLFSQDMNYSGNQAKSVPAATVVKNPVKVQTVSNSSMPMNSVIYGNSMTSFENPPAREEKLAGNLTSYDVFYPIQKKNKDIDKTISTENGQEITIHFNSALGYISFEIGNKN